MRKEMFFRNSRSNWTFQVKLRGVVSSWLGTPPLVRGFDPPTYTFM